MHRVDAEEALLQEDALSPSETLHLLLQTTTLTSPGMPSWNIYSRLVGGGSLSQRQLYALGKLYSTFWATEHTGVEYRGHNPDLIGMHFREYLLAALTATLPKEPLP